MPKQTQPKKITKKTVKETVSTIVLQEKFRFKDIFDAIIADPDSAFSKITGNFALKGFDGALNTDPEWALVINFLETSWKYSTTKDLLKSNIGLLKSLDNLPYDARLLALAEVQKLHCDSKMMKQYAPNAADLTAITNAICIPINEVKKIDDAFLFACLPTARKGEIIREDNNFDIYDSKSSQYVLLTAKNATARQSISTQKEADINIAFAKLTNNIFANLQDWPLEDMVFAGNFVRKLVLGEIPDVESDVDIFIKGKNAEERQKTFNRIIAAFKARGARFARYGMSVVNVFLKGYPHTFQVVHTGNLSGLSVVQGFDMSHVGCFIQNSKVYVTPLFLVGNQCQTTFVLPGYNELLPLRVLKALKCGLNISVHKQNKFMVDYLDENSRSYEYITERFEKLAIATSEPKWEVLSKIEDEKSFDVLLPRLYSNMMHTCDSDLIIKTTVQANSIKRGYSQSLFLADCDITHIAKFPMQKERNGYKNIASVIGKDFVFTVISKVIADKDKISVDLSAVESVALTAIAKHLATTAKIGKIREQSHLYDKNILQANLLIPINIGDDATRFVDCDHKSHVINPASDIREGQYYRVLIGLRVQAVTDSLYLEPVVRTIFQLNSEKQKEAIVAAPVKAAGRRIAIN